VLVLLAVSSADEVRRPYHKLPLPMLLWNFRDVNVRPLAFEFAHGIILLAREFARHFDRKRHTVQRTHAGRELVAARRALPADRQILCRPGLDQCRLLWRHVFALMQFVKINFLWHVVSPLGCLIPLPAARKDRSPGPPDRCFQAN
jgi:hypothetical protein